MKLKELLELINQLVKDYGTDILEKKVYVGDDDGCNDFHATGYVDKWTKEEYEDIPGLEDEDDDIIALF
jgi:hypothetical protein